MSTQLSYFIPQAHRNKISLCIPETFNLHICPPSCVRRVSVRALRNNTRDCMGFYYLDEADVISGRYSEAIGDAVKAVLDTYKGSIKGFYIYFNCVDDFLGTDENDVLNQLYERFPDLSFSILRMNPVSNDVHLPTGSIIHARLYELLHKTEEQAKSINIVGTFVPLMCDCELFAVLGTLGIGKVNQLFECTTFDEYQELAQARLNLVLGGIGQYAAQCMQNRLGIEYLDAFVSYNLEEVEHFYNQLIDTLRVGCSSLQPANDLLKNARKEAKAHVDCSLKTVGNTALVIDSSAFMCPFSAARSLLGYGFNLKAVFAMHSKEFDIDDRIWLQENHPEIEIIDSQCYEDIVQLNIGSDVVCVGYDCAYLLRAHHFVDIYKDEGLFGYQAISHLMDALIASLTRNALWED